MKKLTTEQNRIAQAKYKTKKLSEGKCWQCRGLLDNDTNLCSACVKEQSKRVRARHARLLEEGLCIRCGKVPPVDNLQLCERCRRVGKSSARKRNGELLENGICTECRIQTTSDGFRKCDTCRFKGMETSRRIKEILIFGYGGRCNCCHETRFEFLTLDHVNNDGKKERALRGQQIYRRLIREGFPDGYQILCFNCNCAKGVYGICPHEWADTEIIAPREKSRAHHNNPNNPQPSASV